MTVVRCCVEGGFSLALLRVLRVFGFLFYSSHVLPLSPKNRFVYDSLVCYLCNVQGSGAGLISTRFFWIDFFFFLLYAIAIPFLLQFCSRCVHSPPIFSSLQLFWYMQEDFFGEVF